MYSTPGGKVSRTPNAKAETSGSACRTTSMIWPSTTSAGNRRVTVPAASIREEPIEIRANIIAHPAF